MQEAKDTNVEDIPSELFLKGVKVTTEEIEEVFAEFFESKVKTLSDSAVINANVYNGQRRLPVLEDKKF